MGMAISEFLLDISQCVSFLYGMGTSGKSN